MSTFSRIASWLANISIYKFPFFVMFGDVHYKIKSDSIREIISVLKPGDVLLRRYDHYLSSLLVPGYWSHVALYVGDDQVIHAVGAGVVKEDILMFFRCDDVCVLRCDDQALVKEAVFVAYEQLAAGVGYDYAFDLNCSKKFYCSEFVSYCYNRPKFNDFKGKYLLPDDFLNSIFNKIWPK